MEKVTYKVVLIGDASVGKSSLMARYADNYFRQESCSTVAIDFRCKQLQVEKKTIKLEIWDTAGQQRFRTISPSYYKNAHAVILVFDLMNKKTFQNIQSYWLQEIKKHAQNQPEIIILGNKEDSQVVKIHKQQLEQLGLKHSIPCFQVSAKTGNGVSEAFQILADKCVQKSKAKQGSKKDMWHAGAKKPSGFSGKINRTKKTKQRCY